VLFTHADGLRTAVVHDISDDGPIIATADTLAGFEVAGADQKYYPAGALIDGSSVVVSSASVPAPIAVRYGWIDTPAANLQNSAGLFASPFKTDNWAWTTMPKPPTK
jgi:sialate O-acetylesterase